MYKYRCFGPSWTPWNTGQMIYKRERSYIDGFYLRHTLLTNSVESNHGSRHVFPDIRQHFS